MSLDPEPGRKAGLPSRTHSVWRWLRNALEVLGWTFGGGLAGFFAYGGLASHASPHGTEAAIALLVGMSGGFATSLAVIVSRAKPQGEGSGANTQ